MAKQPVLYKKRGEYWYFKRRGEKNYHSTGVDTNKADAMDYVKQEDEKAKQQAERLQSGYTLRSFTENFFVWDKCEWIRNRHARDKSFTRAVAQSRRGHLDNHILPVFGDCLLTELLIPA